MAETALPVRKAKKGKDTGSASKHLELSPPPPYFDHRIAIFEKLKAKHDAEIAQKPRKPINITLPDGKIEIGESWETTPAKVARSISKSLLERTVISRVNGELWDINRPLESDCELSFLDFNDEEGKKVFWHSSAHILGEAAERRFGCDLCIGPPTDDGFYYEMALPEQQPVREEDKEPLTTLARSIIKDKQPFERLTLSKEDLLEMFQTNKYKQHIIKDKIPDGTFTTVYRCGPLIDLCRGPHVPDTGRIKAFQVLKNSASYFLGDAKNDSLQRIYGISFPEKKMLDEHMKYLEEAAKRDHRKIGKEQELFFFHELSPGSCFFLPHGTIIYNTLQAFIRSEYWKRGYQEVVSPNMYNSELWKRSGHWQYYKDDMFTFDIEKEKWALKPMNCPGHTLIFAHRERSYRELPIRMSDFGILHRNEASGALGGLTRVRRFVQDDSHIFCAESQLRDEMAEMFDFLQTVYGKFGFTFRMKLSTRPEKYLGDINTWNKAEDKLKEALDEYCQAGNAKWELNPGDGAFYGPKIDITIMDALKRQFQCATIQLDFVLPARFNLRYATDDVGHVSENAGKPELPPAAKVVTAPESAPTAAEPEAKSSCDRKGEESEFVEQPLPAGYARPVMIHRAVYGSFERFIGILIEHFGGKWPFWLSPRQVLIVPVMVNAHSYVEEVHALLRKHQFHADMDISGNTLNKKIRNGQLLQYNFIMVLGAAEMEKRTVSIRVRDQDSKAPQIVMPLDEAIEKLAALRESRNVENVL
ncbi:threonyl-tRNA synthetase [Eremomyces bilateralis CBS 781.70]|uniref:threonine--tRNA ligase n=1 Tax=Eremomyces bilateralis CBS 781.70 TaxID=1392243 RepID=A0A6G1GFT7_9PEZI|nr:threonyl-tRNA synthetase [Eremomyces bilateralis CBS 781.70]KAF1816720.1 threonyl-tRNA synthetase [Eremomyces bilateralis CBS 781.70]